MDFITPNLNLLRGLIGCINSVYFWTYDSHRQIVFSDCPDKIIYDKILSLDGHKELLFDPYTQESPVILSSFLNLIWVADFEKDIDGHTRYVHLIGPAFYDEVSRRTLDKALEQYQLSISAKHGFIKMLEQLTVLNTDRATEYALMLHYCITGKRISRKEVKMLPVSSMEHLPENKESLYHGTYHAEQTALKMIENGNLDFREHRERITMVGNVGKLSNGDPLRQAKNAVIIYSALCSRAAIRGGLSEETAFTLNDLYIQQTEACSRLEEVSFICTNMENEFLHRVHELKVNSSVSRPIRECCDYIQFHITEPIHISELAKQVGYSESYLSRKFRREMNMTLIKYIQNEKMEKAKELLYTSNTTVQDISAMLGFTSQSYFGEQFHKYTGVTPGQYRMRSRQPSGNE